MSKKLDKGYYHEAADRISVAQDNLENNIRNHPVFRKHKKWRKKFDKAQSILSSLYQKVALKL